MVYCDDCETEAESESETVLVFPSSLSRIADMYQSQLKSSVMMSLSMTTLTDVREITDRISTVVDNSSLGEYTKHSHLCSDGH